MPTEKIKRSYRKTRYILYKETLIDYKEHFWSFLGSNLSDLMVYRQDSKRGLLGFPISRGTKPDSNSGFLVLLRNE